jgi:hypothetical protein
MTEKRSGMALHCALDIVDQWTAEVVRLGLRWAGGGIVWAVAGRLFLFPSPIQSHGGRLGWGCRRRFMRKRYRRRFIDCSVLVKMRQLRKDAAEAEGKLW